MLRKNFSGRKNQRRIEAEQRQASRNTITDKQQLQKLDRMFGKNKGAIKERVKLLQKINNK